jgi:hypothetical protein
MAYIKIQGYIQAGSITNWLGNGRKCWYNKGRHRKKEDIDINWQA